MTNRFRRCAALLALALLTVGLLPLQAIAEPIDPMQQTWMRTDQPVASGEAARTWMWGPQEIAYATDERYLESPDGEREVIYYDKARMEVTRPNDDASSPWYVTNGLLVVEMVEGRFQTGDAAFDDAPEPANVPVVGDPDGGGLTYAEIAAFELREQPARAVGDLIWEYVDDDGAIRTGDPYHGYGVTAAYEVDEPGIHHTVASVFWEFMNSSGAVYEGGQSTTDSLFENPFYATGYPITEAYWTSTIVGGSPTEVLWQCFERRCLTWTPTNDPGWQVEAGNVGLHYYRWRYGEDRPAAPTLEVTFNFFYQGEQVGQTTTHETFLGDTAVGTWATVAPDGSELSHGTLVADHSISSVEAAIVQNWPFEGAGTLAFEYGFSLTGVGGDGTLAWSADLPTGPESGVVTFTATSTSLDVWDIVVDSLPPVLFTGS
jgi:hypothetical protein